jgi:pyrimidine deaminase RibD-like protein
MDKRQKFFSKSQLNYIRLAMSLACRSHGQTSPNPMVGVVLVRWEKVAK